MHLKRPVVKSFAVLRLKREGKKFVRDAEVQKQLLDWVADNVPKEALR